MIHTRGPWIRGMVLGGLILLAVLIRLYNSNAPFVEPPPQRSGDSAVLAQSLYHLEDPSTPDWKRRVAQTNYDTAHVMEPRIMERLTALGYRVTGVCCWLPRLLSSLFWCLAAVALYRLVAEIYGCGAAFISAAFFLFTPFAIFWSRLFQPDPLMTALTVWSIYALWCEFHRPTRLTLIGSILATGAAMLVKIPCAMILAPTLITLAWGRYGFRGALGKGRVWVLGIGACLPALLYYGGGLFVTGVLRYQVGTQWDPSLYLQERYWLTWAICLVTTVGIPALVLSWAGFCLPAPRSARALIAGLWAGYILGGLVFNVACLVEYYHMPLTAIVAITLGASLARLIKGLWRTRPGFRYTIASAAIGLVVMAAWIGFSKASGPKRILSPQFRGSVEAALNLCGANTLCFRQWSRHHDDIIQTAEEIGRKVNHSSHVIIIGGDFFRFLEYHGLVTARCWPGRTGGQLHRAGKPFGPLATTFERFCNEPNPEFLLAWPADGLDRSPELKRYLEQRYPVLECNDQYLIFDMRTSLEPVGRPGPQR